jgi:uncharacterized protein YndB with AHSA1/START domain
MNNPSESKFVYVTFIRTTPERLWGALTTPEFTKQYWFGMHCESEWKVGSSWQLKFQDGRIADAGEIVEAERPKRLVIKWRNEFKPEMKAEGYSRCTIELEPRGEAVKLTITHEMEKPGHEIHRGGFGGLAAYPVQPQIASGDRRNSDERRDSLTVIDLPRLQSALATRRDALNRSRWSSSRHRRSRCSGRLWSTPANARRHGFVV